jgi:hypothetical protein
VSADTAPRRARPVPLAAMLVAITILVCRTADYAPAAYSALVALLLLATALAAWFAGARAVTSSDPVRRMQAAAGILLVAPFVLFALLVGVGPPHDQPPADNALRFLVLTVDALLVGSGLLVLRQSLASAGETLWSTLGAAAATWATPLYVAFTLIQRCDYVADLQGWSWAAAVMHPWHELTALDAFSMAALFFAGLLTYVATAAFAAALAAAAWTGPRLARVFIALSAVAFAFLVARGFAYPGLEAAFAHWYSIPGFVVGIPAVPWMMPCAMGVLLLRRAGS